MIKVDVVSTGSSGNFCVLEDMVAIDAGISYKRIEPYMDKLKLVLLTHVHGDHFKASSIRRMALEKPKLRFACGSFLAQPLVEAGVAKSQIVIMQPKMMYGFGICNVIPFELEHDVPNFGYKIHFPQGKVFYATDMANLNGIVAKDYDLYMVEANYQKDEIKARMDAKKAEGLFAYEQRVLKYHMSKEDCDNWLVRMSGPNSEFMYLHCHEERGEP